MAQIAFILLCHKDPEGVISQARRLTEAGDFVAKPQQRTNQR